MVHRCVRDSRTIDRINGMHRAPDALIRESLFRGGEASAVRGIHKECNARIIRHALNREFVQMQSMQRGLRGLVCSTVNGSLCIMHRNTIGGV